MPRSVVGLLAAVGATMAALVGLVHGDSVPVMIAGAGASTGVAAYLALPSSKKNLVNVTLRNQALGAQCNFTHNLVA